MVINSTQTDAQMKKRITSLYAITFPNGKKYIGLSVDPKERFRQHKAEARNGNYKLHHAMRKCDFNVSLEILMIGERSFISEMEIKAIAAYKTQDDNFGYNTAIGGDLGTMYGRKHSDETKAILSAKKTGKPNPSMLGNKYGAGGTHMIGRKASAETKAKMSATRKGRPSDKKGITLTDEHRAKCSAALKGRVGPNLGKKASVETRLKLSAAHKGNTYCLGNKSSEKTKQKLRILIGLRERDSLGRIKKVTP